MTSTQTMSRKLLPIVLSSFLLSNTSAFSFGLADVTHYIKKPFSYVKSIDTVKRNRFLLAVLITYTFFEAQLVLRGTKENFVPRYQDFKPKTTGDYLTLLKYYYQDFFLGQRLKEIPLHIKQENGDYKVDAIVVQPAGLLGNLDAKLGLYKKSYETVIIALTIAALLNEPIGKANNGTNGLLATVGINIP